MLVIRFHSAVLTTSLILSGVIAVPLIGADPPAKMSTRQTAEQPEVIRDRRGRTLGTIRRTSNGRLEARDRLGRLLGVYGPKVNLTRDRLGRILNRGNTLSALVVRSAEVEKR